MSTGRDSERYGRSKTDGTTKFRNGRRGVWISSMRRWGGDVGQVDDGGWGAEGRSGGKEAGCRHGRGGRAT